MSRRLIAARAFALAAALLPAALAPPTPARKSPVEFDQVLRKGYDLERSGQWHQAIQLYEDAAKAHPNSPLLQERLRLCEIHHSLARRYKDPSFRAHLLRLSRSKALSLYGEVTEKIDDHYVELADWEAQFRSGLDYLIVACEDPLFLKTNLAEVPPEQIAQFRDRLRSWKQVTIRNRWDAHREVDRIAELAESWLGLGTAPTIWEFVYGAFEGLDDYSTCLTPSRLDDLYAVIDGNFVGIGVELRNSADGLVVVNSLAGGPAVEAGIRADDRIVAVDSVPTVGLTLEEAASRLQGKENSQLELWVLSPGDSEPRRLILTRRAVQVRSVSAVHLLSPADGIGYIHLSAFQKSSRRELEQAVAWLERGGLRGLILDLRGNPGGLLNSSVDISDKFLTEGTIVSIRGRAQGQSYTYRAHRPGTWSFPLIVLIDSQSASASEILAGAIQDHRRGTIIGQRSFGKGSVQSIIPLDTADAGIRLTTARFFSPRGRPYFNNGVVPDIAVERETLWQPSGPTITQLNPASDAQLAAAMQACRQSMGGR